MYTVLLEVTTVAGVSGTFAHLTFATTLQGPHPYLFDALTLTLYVVPPTIPELVVKEVVRSLDESPLMSVQISPVVFAVLLP